VRTNVSGAGKGHGEGAFKVNPTPLTERQLDRFMAYIITEPCIGTKDKSCVDVCPVDCIHGSDDDKQLFIDPEVCIDCGACVSACPVEAIYADSDVPDKWKSFIDINAEFYKK
jgi:ferredoxin